MADEIRLTTYMTVRNSNLTRDWKPTEQRITQAVSRAAGGVQNVGTTHEAVAVGDISTLGWAHFANLDSTNYVELGLDVAAAFVPMARLNAGEKCLLRLAQGITLYAKANTAAVLLDYEIFNN